MLVFYKERLVFLSVPKTGSTAWQQALSARADIVISDPPALKHAPVYRYNRFLRPMFKNVCGAEMELLAAIREPISWLGSWYRYRQRPAMHGHPNSTAEMSFDAFVEAYCEGSPPSFADVGTQEKFLRAQPNGTKVQHLFAYEKPEDLYAFLIKRLGNFPTPTRVNVSPAGPLSLSSDIEDLLRRKHAASFALHQSVLSR